MKIIKEGKLKHPITFECPKCGCQFIEEDAEYTTHDNKYAEVNCPCCGYVIAKDLD